MTNILAEQLERMVAEATARGVARQASVFLSTRASVGQYKGPRPDAEPTDGLPRLRYGIDKLPTRCGHCGSTFLEVEPASFHGSAGAVSCIVCSRQAAWLS